MAGGLPAPANSGLNSLLRPRSKEVKAADEDESVSRVNVFAQPETKARGVSEQKLRELIQQNTDARDLGILGDPGVNVLTLNRALDSGSAKP